MSEFMNDVEYLSQEIGPRPAGTEEEQKAALYIADQVRKQTNLKAEIEDISCISNPELVGYIYNGAALFSLLLSIIVPVTGIFCFIIALLAAAIFLTEEVFDKPILSKLLARDISQNVVTKYQPANAKPNVRGPRRKVVVVANYDSGKVMKELNPAVLKFLAPVAFASQIAVLAAPVLILLKDILFSATAGFLSLFFLLLSIVAILLLAVPLARGIMHQVAAYNEAANVNASGVAVLLESMRQISANGDIDIVDQIEAQKNSADEAEQPEDGEPVIHGEEAAVAAGVVDDDVELVYDDDVRPAEDAPAGAPEDAIAVEDAIESGSMEAAPEVSVDDEHYEEQSAADRLLAAKAAIAGLTGSPVANQVFADIEDNRANFQREEIETDPSDEEIARQRAGMHEALGGTGQAADSAEAAALQNDYSASDVPDWFKEAKEKAHRQSSPKKVNRSRYADALEHVEAEIDSRAAEAAHQIDVEAEARLREVRQGISDVKPSVADAAMKAAAPVAAAGAAVARTATDAAAAVASATAAVADATESKVAPIASTPARIETHIAEPPLEEQKPERVHVEPFIEHAVAPAESQEPAPTVELETPVATAPVSQEAPAAELVPVEEKHETAQPIVEEQAKPVSSAEAPEAVEPPVDAAAAAPAVPEEAPEPEKPAVIPQIDNEEMRAAIAAVEAERADSRPIFERVPLDFDFNVAPEFPERGFASAFGDGLIADQVRPAADLAALASVPEVPEAPAEDAGRTVAMPVVPASSEDDGHTIAMPAVPAPSEDAGRTVAMPVVPAPAIDTDDLSSTVAFKAVDIPEVPVQQVADRVEPNPDPLDFIPEPLEGSDAARTMAIPPLSEVNIPEVPDTFEDIPNVVVEDGVPRIVLPEVGDAPVVSNAVPVVQQRAPLAVASEIDGQAAAKSLLSHRLPKISASDLSDDSNGSFSSVDMLSNTDKRASLAGSLPSLSGALAMSDSVEDLPEGPVSTTGSFNIVGGTDAFAPVGDELVADVAPEEMYVDDADDSVYESDMTETGAFAGPDYVKMPKSRFSKIFGRFGKKKQDDMATPQEWLDVDEDFDARSVGKERGDWSSFRSESADYYNSQDDEWRGGAYSRDRGGRTLVDDSDPTEVNDITPNNEYVDADDAGQAAAEPEAKGSRFAGMKDKFSALASKIPNRGNVDESGDSNRTARRERASRRAERQEMEARRVERMMLDVDPEVQEELREVQRFQANGDYNTEVWFVALGAEMSGHAGIKAFVKEHESELKGAIVVNLEAMGAGHLSGITKEGIFKKVSPSTRLKRFMRNASQLSGVTAGTAEMTWRDSTSSYVMRKGLQSISFVGMDGQKPALMGQSDDVIESIDEQTLADNTQYLLVLLRSI